MVRQVGNWESKKSQGWISSIFFAIGCVFLFACPGYWNLLKNIVEVVLHHFLCQYLFRKICASSNTCFPGSAQGSTRLQQFFIQHGRISYKLSWRANLRFMSSSQYWTSGFVKTRFLYHFWLGLDQLLRWNVALNSLRSLGES